MVTDERHSQNANYRHVFQREDTVCVKDDPGVLMATQKALTRPIVIKICLTRLSFQQGIKVREK